MPPLSLAQPAKEAFISRTWNSEPVTRRAVGRSENSKRHVMMWWALSVPSWDRVNWSAQNWGGTPVPPSPTALIAWKGGGLKNKDSEMKLSPKGHSKLSSKISFYSGWLRKIAFLKRFYCIAVLRLLVNNNKLDFFPNTLKSFSILNEYHLKK